jgi:hypothetical protein
VPAAVDRRKVRACNLAAGGSSSPSRLRAAAKKLNGAMKVAARSRRKRTVSSDCAGALAADLRDARDRVERLLAPGGHSKGIFLGTWGS